MDDVVAVAALAASSWETMAADAAAFERALKTEHCLALEEILAAEFEAFLMPGTLSGMRLEIARLRLARAERRLGK